VPSSLTSNVQEPSETYNAEIEKKEIQRLKSKVESLTDADKKKVYEDGLKLLELQDTVEGSTSSIVGLIQHQFAKPFILSDLSCLPSLQVADVPLKAKTYHVSQKILEPANVPIQIRETATNEVSYITLGKSIKNLGKDLVPYLPLYCNVSFWNIDRDMAMVS
jgi:Zn-dependent M16 (insulinase) family peptidase